MAEKAQDKTAPQGGDETKLGYRGTVADETPNSAYTVKGVTGR